MTRLMLGHRGQTSRLDGPVRTPVGWTVRPCATAQRPAVRHSRAIADPTLPSDRRTPAMSDRTGKTDGRSRDHASAVHIPKATGPSILLCLLAACIQIPAAQHPAPKAGVGVAVESSSGTVSVDASKVPMVTGACPDGDVVARSGSGWACEPADSGPKGESGVAGSQGPAGASVVADTLGAGDSHCPNGGSELTVGGVSTYACNGAPGQPGAKGGQGQQGNPGDTGPQGTPVVATSLDAGDGHCPNGGTEFVEGSEVVYACSGATGAQGTPGTSCDATAVATLQNSLTTLQGDIQTLQDTVKGNEIQLSTLEANLCPPGWSVATETGFAGTLCEKTVAGATDEMVKVGDYWIDRFEMSTCGSGSMGDASGNGYGTTAVGCSVSGVAPQANITWFQAAQMCANAGKKLCTNQEWQIAASGTPDPGASDGTGGACNTPSSGPRKTGLGTACRSTFGAEDMIGNLWERTSEWHQAGVTWMTSDGQSATPWPSGYGSDATWNINGRAEPGTGGFTNGLPASVLRGGDWETSTNAGAFSTSWRNGPSDSGASIGARCCIGG